MNLNLFVKNFCLKFSFVKFEHFEENWQYKYFFFEKFHFYYYRFENDLRFVSNPTPEVSIFRFQQTWINIECLSKLNVFMKDSYKVIL